MGSVLALHVKFEDEPYVRFGSHHVRESQLLAPRSGVFVYACVLLCVGGGSVLRGDENTSPKKATPAAVRPSARPAASSPHSARRSAGAQGNSCPAPLEKLPHAAVERTLRHADGSALTSALEERAPAERGRGGRGERRLP